MKEEVGCMQAQVRFIIIQSRVGSTEHIWNDGDRCLLKIPNENGLCTCRLKDPLPVLIHTHSLE